MTDHALSFGIAAGSYDRYRPTYPPEAIDWAIGSPTARPGRLATGPASAVLRVVDLGAGTGILTRVLLGLGHEVLPVEPDAAMRDQLASATPGAQPLAGSSEAIPLPDGSADAVVAGQAYHWFDRTRAPLEIARVLRPGGSFAAVWNMRDDAVPWVARLSEVAQMADDERREKGVDEPALRAAGFGPVDRAVFTHAVTHTPDSLVELMKTRSDYLAAPAARQAEIAADVREFAATHPDLAGRDRFDLPFRTVVFRTRHTR